MWRRSSIQIPLALGVGMLLLVAALTVAWVLILVNPRFLERTTHWGTLALGSVFFALIMVGLVLYMVLTMKEVRLNQRQTNFIDSVTHELKLPIASLRMYLETLELRTVTPDQQHTFHKHMLEDVQRLDTLINHLLEVARLGHHRERAPLEDVPLEPLLRECATRLCQRHRLPPETVRFEMPPAVVRGRPSVLDIVFRNLLDNAIRYSGPEPEVLVRVSALGEGRIQAEISDNGTGVPVGMRRRIFRRFERGGNELERTQTGMGLGLYIARALVRLMKGQISVQDRGKLPGTTFAVTLPGRLA